MHIGGITVANSYDDGVQAFKSSMHDKLDELRKSGKPITLQVVDNAMFGIYRRKKPKLLSQFNYWLLAPADVE